MIIRINEHPTKRRVKMIQSEQVAKAMLVVCRLQDLRIRSLVHEGQWNLYCTSRGGSTGRQAGLVTRLDFLNLTLASLYTDISIFNLSLKTQKNRTGTFFVKIIEPLAPVRFKNKEDKPSFFFLGQSETTSPHSNVPFRCSVAISLCLFTG